jgi:pSer/pThr/pTyr-binding forkhead associated (FHA) protein
MIVPALDDTLTLVDLNSVHGTFVNGRRVRRQILKTSDVITFCRYRLSLARVGESRELGPEPPHAGPPPRRPSTRSGASTAGR